MLHGSKLQSCPGLPLGPVTQTRLGLGGEREMKGHLRQSEGARGGGMPPAPSSLPRPAVPPLPTKPGMTLQDHVIPHGKSSNGTENKPELLTHGPSWLLYSLVPLASVAAHQVTPET